MKLSRPHQGYSGEGHREGEGGGKKNSKVIRRCRQEDEKTKSYLVQQIRKRHQS